MAGIYQHDFSLLSKRGANKLAGGMMCNIRKGSKHIHFRDLFRGLLHHRVVGGYDIEDFRHLLCLFLGILVSKVIVLRYHCLQLLDCER